MVTVAVRVGVRAHRLSLAKIPFSPTLQFRYRALIEQGIMSKSDDIFRRVGSTNPIPAIGELALL